MTSCPGFGEIGKLILKKAYCTRWHRLDRHLSERTDRAPYVPSAQLTRPACKEGPTFGHKENATGDALGLRPQRRQMLLRLGTLTSEDRDSPKAMYTLAQGDDELPRDGASSILKRSWIVICGVMMRGFEPMAAAQSRPARSRDSDDAWGDWKASRSAPERSFGLEGKPQSKVLMLLIPRRVSK